MYQALPVPWAYGEVKIKPLANIPVGRRKREREGGR